MKRILVILLLISVTVAFAACENDGKHSESTVIVYYKSASTTYGTADGVIAPYELDATGHESDIAYLLNAYFSEPVSDLHTATYPRLTQLVSLELDGLTAKITMNDDFAKLTGLNLSLACSCLTQTVISLTGCQEVIISAQNMKLDGQYFITLSRDSYLLLDESDAD